MELDAILDGIKKAGNQQIAQIEHETEQEASQILVRVQKEAEGQKNRILSDGKTRLNREQALISQQAVIQSLQIHADARQTLIESVLDQVEKRFKELRKEKEYEKILSNLVAETVHSITPSLLRNQKMVFHFDPRDKEIAERIIKQYKQPVSIQFDIECSGGCNAETEDNKVFVLNTVESRFEHAAPYIKQNLSIFFERKYASS
ncbi:V-type ATP synthase subunit E [Pelolinea submarina]|uniref:Vacuolar-type H+-ATPase subunit E/Vma4 n=1 Tax=Pelolinea submarina TaxID=913107 RepID=A0A347ZNE0_9CHLR|nr:V-type ATP synthase subunit E [Pelolinea submarina]REG08423.1 vacuolar-type H+-ATPase subunit E/Vma4 [Pelolinea submarina]BBB46821.1 V/A-type H+/Na+-transporting ATPase subunit E [Pelolinea submarina]